MKAMIRAFQLLLLLLIPQTVRADEYAVIDSIEVHGLVFLGMIQRAIYGYDDSIHCQLVVANRSTLPISFMIKTKCTPLLSREAWCDSTGPYWDCVSAPEPDLRFCVGSPTSYPMIIDPGEHVIATASFPSRRPQGDSWWFNGGYAFFFNPWPEYEPYFEFAVRYHRVGPTGIDQVTWSVLKGLYR
jgi:hypothetical protein